MLGNGFLSRLVVIVSTFIGALGRVNFDDWHCGSSDFTRRMSFESITEKCESIMVAVNHCCVVHDVCYTHQLGQEQCDVQFCECNRKAAILRHDCLDLLEATCSLVQLFGFGAYHNSANYTEPDDLVKHTPHSHPLNAHFGGIYQQCAKVNATISSCALQYNLCEDASVECAGTLSECLFDAATVDGRASCREAVKLMSIAVVNGMPAITIPFEKSGSGTTFHWNHRLLGPDTLRILMGACSMALVYFVLRLRNATKFDEKSLKYSPV